MTRNEQIKLVTGYVKKHIIKYDSGHDWWHIDRVRNIALYINNIDGTEDPFVIELTALLHDIGDSKFSGKDKEHGYTELSVFMDEIGLSYFRDRIIDVIRNVSFSNKTISGNPEDQLLHIIQDADRLDAIGAIGIARAFNYGGFRNNAIYIPGEKSEGNSKSTIGHFYDKLLKIKGMMHSTTGKKLAGERHLILEKFLEQFYDEWNFGTNK
jgi:uncharacterized protein